MIKLSVILVEYNSLPHTKECIDSIFRNKEIEITVILVDNSDEEDPEMQSLVRQNDIIYLKTDRNIGFGQANNKGISYALAKTNPDYVLLLNNDTVIQPDTLQKLIKPFQEQEGLGIATSRIVYYHEPDKIWYGGAQLSRFLGWPLIEDLNKNSDYNKSSQSRDVEFISGCVMMFSKESLEKIKGFDEDFFMYVEDLELSIRALEMGYRLWYTADTTVLHKVQASKNSGEAVGLSPHNPNLPFQFYHRTRNHWLTYRKHLNGIRFIIFNLVFNCFLRLKFWLLYFKTAKKIELKEAFKQVKLEIRAYGKR